MLTNNPVELKKEMEIELISILSWWEENMIDETNGGFYGKIDGYNKLHPKAEKGVILNTRILWAYSAAANLIKNPTYTKIADRAFDYLITYFTDKKNSGLFWMLDLNGSPTQRKKQIYAQAFGIYGLSEYYHLTENKLAIKLATQLFDCIENYSRDKIEGGYFEAFTEDWQQIEDLRLSEKDANEAKTMNTHLHILEAYTNLHRVFPSQKTEAALRDLIQLFLDKFIDYSTGHLHLFFDEKWTIKSSAISYGHDIEASWLLVEAAEVLVDKVLLEKVKETAILMAKVTLKEGIDQSAGVNYEIDNGHSDQEKHWWVQAEAVVGFINAFEMTKDEKYLKAGINCWNFIQKNILDSVNGEWVWSVDTTAEINTQEDKAGAWKAPYHNGRMCMELIRRLN